MPQEPLEALIERMKADAQFRAELMAKEDVAERMELIFSEVLSCALEEMHHAEWNIVEDGMEKSDQSNSGCDKARSLPKGSSPQTAGYAKPSKAIEQRFRD